uniref:Uncharacterized protein n=1 Tax=Kalanchoe fedtschenkoi TaxID=63787 RepID=A0A7N0URF8_KALFE
MGKNEKTMLGRSLVKHMNQVAQQNKEKGRMYNKQNKKVLESVTEVTDIEAVLEQAEESERLFSSENPFANVFNMDKGSNSKLTAEDRKREEALHASSLRVPRRPAWHARMSADELDANETQSFLVWRRNLASLEENENLVLTPFEKNLDIWRQLWRVLERSDLLVMVVDARDPVYGHPKLVWVWKLCMATQNSPFSFTLTLSGDPGTFANISDVPAFSPFNQYLLNLQQTDSQNKRISYQ